MNYDEMVFMGGLRIKEIKEIANDNNPSEVVGRVLLKPDAPDGKTLGELHWYVSPDIMRRLKIDQRIAMLAPGEMYG